MHRHLKIFAMFLLAAASVAAIILPDVLWRRTGIPTLLGTWLHQLEGAREQALYAAELMTKPVMTELPVPVIGVAPNAIADTYGAPRGDDRIHEGVDIFASRGSYVRSATEGIVLRIGSNTLGGLFVIVLGPGGERYYYAHLDEIDEALAEGARVSTTTLLGRVGTTGNAIGTLPHLHFGIYYANRQTVDPLPRMHAHEPSDA